MQHGRHVAAGEDIAGKQQHGQAVDGCQRSAGNHVGCAGADGGGAGKGAHSVAGLGKPRRQVHAGLLIAHQDVFEIGVLLQSLAYAGHVSVTEDAEHSREECILLSIAFDILVLQKLNQGLRHCHATRVHLHHLFTMGTLGSFSFYVVAPKHSRGRRRPRANAPSRPTHSGNTRCSHDCTRTEVSSLKCRIANSSETSECSATASD